MAVGVDRDWSQEGGANGWLVEANRSQSRVGWMRPMQIGNAKKGILSVICQLFL